MADDQYNQHVNLIKKEYKQEQTTETSTFGEQIEEADHNASANQELIDENGEMLYREHDEFGEWLDRHN